MTLPIGGENRNMKEKVKGLFKTASGKGAKKAAQNEQKEEAAYRSSRTHFVPGAYYCGSPAE